MTVEELSKGIAELIVLKKTYGDLKGTTSPDLVVEFQSELKNLLATTPINESIKHHLSLTKKAPTVKELIQVLDTTKLELDALLIGTVKKEPSQDLEKKPVDASELTKIQEVTNAIQAFLLLKAKVEVLHDNKETMKAQKSYDPFKIKFKTALQNLITQYKLTQAFNTDQKKLLAQKSPIPTVKDLMSILDFVQGKLEASINHTHLSAVAKQNGASLVTPPMAATGSEVPPLQPPSSSNLVDHVEVVAAVPPVAAATPTETDGGVPPNSSTDALDADHEKEENEAVAESSAGDLNVDHVEVVAKPPVVPPVTAATPTETDGGAPPVQTNSSINALDADHEEEKGKNTPRNDQPRIDREEIVKQLDELLIKLEAENNLLGAQKLQYFQSNRAKRDYTEAETAGKNLLLQLREHRNNFVVEQTTDLAQFKEACESALDTDTIAKLEKQPGYTNLIQKIKFWVANIFTFGIVSAASYFKTGSTFGFFASEAKPAGILANDIKTNVSAMIMG